MPWYLSTSCPQPILVYLNSEPSHRTANVNTIESSQLCYTPNSTSDPNMERSTLSSDQTYWHLPCPAHLTGAMPHWCMNSDRSNAAIRALRVSICKEYPSLPVAIYGVLPHRHGSFSGSCDDGGRLVYRQVHPQEIFLPIAYRHYAQVAARPSTTANRTCLTAASPAAGMDVFIIQAVH